MAGMDVNIKTSDFWATGGHGQIHPMFRINLTTGTWPSPFFLLLGWPPMTWMIIMGPTCWLDPPDVPYLPEDHFGRSN